MSSDSSSDDGMIISHYYHPIKREKREDFGCTPLLRRISVVDYLLLPKNHRNVIRNYLHSTE